MGHGTGICRPCAFFWKARGCVNGQECRHCHLCPDGEIQARRKMKFAQLRTQQGVVNSSMELTEWELQQLAQWEMQQRQQLALLEAAHLQLQQEQQAQWQFMPIEEVDNEDEEDDGEEEEGE